MKKKILFYKKKTTRVLLAVDKQSLPLSCRYVLQDLAFWHVPIFSLTIDVPMVFHGVITKSVEPNNHVWYKIKFQTFLFPFTCNTDWILSFSSCLMYNSPSFVFLLMFNLFTVGNKNGVLGCEKWNISLNIVVGICLDCFTTRPK